ncbi:MAG: hypothetical protein U0T83_04255 [Bacteriovoracaceae bacterium]
MLPLFYQLTPILLLLLVVSCGKDINTNRTFHLKSELSSRFFTVFDRQNSENLSIHINECGGIDQIYDIKNLASQNLIAASFKGERTDRVIQWTYWNSLFKGNIHQQGNKDRRLNITLSGAYDNEEFCRPISTTVNDNSVTIEARASSWFYADLNVHGQPEISSKITYKFIQDGIIEGTFELYRDDWFLFDIYKYDSTSAQHTLIPGVSEITSTSSVRSLSNLPPVSQLTNGTNDLFNSYIELWSPFNGKILPNTFDGNGSSLINSEDPSTWYKNWNPVDLNGYVTVQNSTHGVGVVFGKFRKIEDDFYLTFNKLYTANSGQGYLNTLLPGLFVSWPASSYIKLNFYLIIGSNSEITQLANIYVGQVKAPQRITRQAMR